MGPHNDIAPRILNHQLSKALKYAIYSAHTHKETTHSATILVIPEMKNTPYLARNLKNNYVQKLFTFTYTHTIQAIKKTQYNLNIYLIASSEVLNRLDVSHINNTLNAFLTQE